MWRKKPSLAKAICLILTMTLMLVANVAGQQRGAQNGKLIFSVLYRFKGGKDGAGPIGGLISDAAGNLYGTTAAGGVGCAPWGCGTVFELRRVKGGWAEKVLYRFRGNPKDGFDADTNLAFDTKGNLYGTTYSGGGRGDCSGLGCGVVFELTPRPGGEWKETVLHRFAGGNDGEIPFAGVVLDATGNVYGTTKHGGGGSCSGGGCGVVFELTPSAGGWSESILHSFTGADGNAPYNLVLDGSGNLYGVTGYDGKYGVGVAFELMPVSGGWEDTTLYNFQGSPDGALPDYGLTLKGSNLYGATDVGGLGFGTIFELKPGSNGGWTESVIYRFTGGKDGRYPGGPLVFDATGNLYGNGGGDVSCTKGNRLGCGNIFELLTSDGKWRPRVLHTFTGGKDGAFPSGVISNGKGSFYGVAVAGGDLQCNGGVGGGCGVVFEVTP